MEVEVVSLCKMDLSTLSECLIIKEGQLVEPWICLLKSLLNVMVWWSKNPVLGGGAMCRERRN
jgi:hypothetical protein